MVQVLAEQKNCNVMGVGLGGATTNVYSVFDKRFNRTVSANLGMSYSICNVLKETGVENIKRWIPFEISETYLRDKLRNKMIRPTTIPNTMKELIVEHAVAREAIRLGIEHHRMLAVELRGVHRERTISEIWDDWEEGRKISLVDMMNLEYIIGTGGLLSHAPRRVQTELILLDAFQPEGVAKLVQDSVFMMPHLGVLSSVHPKAAMEVFDKDCLVRLGTCIAPKGQATEGTKVAELTIQMPDGSTLEDEATFGTIKKIPLEVGEKANVEINPTPGFDAGMGRGRSVKTVVEGGVVGITIDARGRPLTLPEDPEKRVNKLMEWFITMDAYPEDLLNEMRKRGQTD